MDSDLSLEEIEKEILKAVKLINIILQEIRSKNESLQKILGMNYAKYIGIASPFEEAIRSLREVKNEFDLYLDIVRKELAVKYRKKYKKR